MLLPTLKMHQPKKLMPFIFRPFAICLKNLVIYNGKAILQWAFNAVWGHAPQIEEALGEHALSHY
jgi:hypothetical protein